MRKETTLLELQPHPAPEPVEARAARQACTALFLALLPALAALGSVPWFVTQDGPAHLYNAHIIAQSLDPGSPFRSYYTVKREPLPNWAGHLLLAGLASILPPLVADRVMTALTLAGLAASILWLRGRVAGPRGMPMAAVLAVLLAMNVTWLLGFTNFLLGACLFPITLGVWWSGRERLTGTRIMALGMLTVLGYFCHLVSLGLTVVGIAVLAVATPGPRRLPRLIGTALGLSPLLLLGPLYVGLTRQGGGLAPEWKHLADPFSPRAWFVQLGWVDPVSLGSKVILPFHESTSPWFALLTPVLWLLVALALASAATVLSRRRRDDLSQPRPPDDRLGWIVLALVLLLGGLAGPDTLGASHGHYMQQRVILLGLVALVPILDLEVRGTIGRAMAGALVLALVLQSTFVWDYALASNRTVGGLMEARAAVGRHQRVAALLSQIRGRFRANPILHADNLLGVGTGNILWTNYETHHYYFPVQFRATIDRPDALELERITLMDHSRGSAERAERWRLLLEDYHPEIDVLVVWGDDPTLDAITRRWFEPTFCEGNVRVLRPRDRTSIAARSGR